MFFVFLFFFEGEGVKVLFVNITEMIPFLAI